jgi:starch-binding outer membrane protein SusE/F
MNKNILLLLTFIGLIGIFSSCEKDGTEIVMSANPTAPTLDALPNLTLLRSKGTDTIEFKGTPVDPGFQASATYFLEACPVGNNFANTTLIYSGVQNKSIKISVSDLNSIFLKKFPADQASSVDFRFRAILVVDAGTGAAGTSTKPFEYISETKNANVTIYGLPRLDLQNSGRVQKIESALGNGKYKGYVKLNVDNAFTLRNPDTNTSYGGSGGTLTVNGPGIPVGSNGWYMMNADINALTYSMDPYMIGLIGSATPNGWNTPDQKMDYNAQAGTWSITIDLIDGEIKFRKNDGWAWNLGGTPGNLTQGGANIPVTAGNYTITLTIINDATGTCTIVKN